MKFILSHSDYKSDTLPGDPSSQDEKESIFFSYNWVSPDMSNFWVYQMYHVALEDED